MSDDENDDTLPWHGEPACPNCDQLMDVVDVFDGSEVRCRGCGAVSVATAFMPSPGYPRGSFSLIRSRVPMAPRPRDRRATRARWRRQGRR